MIIIETQAVGPFHKNGFVVACPRTRQGVIIDPGDEASFGATLISALTDSERRAVRIARGRERARSYSWEATARQTFELLRSIRDR